MTSYFKSGLPIQTGLIQRDNLLDKLSGVLNYPLTILSAPSGCGKTALATQLAQMVDADVIWHTVSQYEQDLGVFLRLLLSNLEVTIPGISSLQAIMQQPTENVVLELTSYLREYLQQDMLLVIDDWHQLSTSTSDDFLEFFVKQLPPQCHVMVLSQRTPRIRMIELIAKRQLLRLTQQELFFTRPEVYMLASQLPQHALDASQIESIWEKLQGWPVGTILALQPVNDILESYTSDAGNGPSTSEMLFQSISAKMLTQELPDTQHFLKWTSTGEYFNQEICEEVFNIQDSEFLLAEVIQRNLFVSQRAGGYQYHQLFRNFLQKHFKLTQPEDYRSAHRRLAAWYQSHNQPNRAIEHYLLAESHAQAIELAESIVYAYYAQGRIDTILNIGNKLQGHHIATPNLDHVRAQIYLAYDMDLEQALTYTQRALDAFTAQDNHYSTYDAMITMGLIHQTRNQLDEALHLFREVLAVEDLPDSLKGNALNQLGLTEHYLGDNNSALRHLKQAFTIVKTHNGLFHLAKLYQELELVHRELGNVSEANDCLEKQIHLWQQLNNPESLAMAYNNLGYRYYEKGDYNQAHRALRQGLDAIANMRSTRSQYYLFASLGDLQRDCKQYAEARITYQRALNLIAEQEPYAHAEVLTNLSTLYRWQARYEAALTCAEDALKKAHDHQLQYRYLQAMIANWHIRLQPWSIRDIQSEIAAKDKEYPNANLRQMVEFITLNLRIALLNSDMAGIHSTLQQLNHLHNNQQSIQPFVAEVTNNEEMGSFWNKVKHQYPDLNYAIEQRQLRDETQQRIVPLISATHSLHFYTLGVERIRQNNNYIKVAGNYAELVREFLYYFVFIGESTREQIESIFWPDKPLDARKDNFHQTLSRVRAAFGNRIIVYNEASETYYLDPDLHIWCDALLLDSFVTEVRHLSNVNQHTFHLLYQSTQLTYGEFLPRLNSTWVVQKREYFRQLSIEAWMGLADYYRHHMDYRSALATYENIESFDPYHEASYRARMECYSALGETASIAKTFIKLKDRLKRDLRIEPSSQSVNLYQQLTTSAS